MIRTGCAALVLALAGVAQAGGPYPAQTGISASADSAATAGMNPAGMTRFDSRNMRVELLGFFPDNTFEGQIGGGPTFVSNDDSETIIPSGNMVMPVRDNLWFGFTILGSGFSEDYGDNWLGRYFIQEYDLLYISAFPSLATKVNDKLSLAGSLAITYTSYEQDKAVPNVDDPFNDGKLNIDTDGFTVGFSVSALYETSDKTRFGFVYRSELDPSLDGKAKFSGLTPATETILDTAGLLDASVDVKSRQPQAINLGMYHEFGNGGAFTFDAVWSDFSEFKLSEIYVDGDRIADNEAIYDDIYAFSVGYNWPINDRWRIGLGAMFVDDMVDDEDRTITLRLDSLWSAGIGVEWQWKDNRIISGSLNYLSIDDAPVTSPDIPGIGSITGRYTQRETIWFQVGVSLGSGPK